MGGHRILVGGMAVPMEEEGLRNGSVGFVLESSSRLKKGKEVTE
jgi:hypothetical protein